MSLAGVTNQIGSSSLNGAVLPLEGRAPHAQPASLDSLETSFAPIPPTNSGPLAYSKPAVSPFVETGPIQAVPPNSAQAKINKIVGDAPKQVGNLALIDPPIKTRVPGDILAKLALIRNVNPQIPVGAIVMQNLEWTVCGSPTVKLLFDCSQSETIENVVKLGDDLKAELHFELSKGDLIMWSEPLLPGDVKSKSSADLFLKSWLERVLEFGIVQPSFYWKEMRNTMKFLSEDDASEAETEIITGASDRLGGFLDDSRLLESKDQTCALTDIDSQSQLDRDESLLFAPSQPTAEKAKVSSYISISCFDSAKYLWRVMNISRD